MVNFSTNPRTDPQSGRKVLKLTGRRVRNIIIRILPPVAFFLGMSGSLGPAKAQSTVGGGQPLAFARLTWQPDRELYEGVAVYEIRLGAPDLASPLNVGSQGARFVLYPNRSVGWASESRREREFNAVGYPGEDIWSMERTGSFVVGSAEWVDHAQGVCRPDLLSALAQGRGQGFSRQPAATALSRSEAVLDVFPRHLALAQSSETCQALVVTFEYVPPRSAGNFGMPSSRRQIFSGPLIPFPTWQFHRTQIVLKGVFASCLQCQTGDDGEVVQVYDTLPSPLHVDLDRPVRTESYGVRGLRVGLVGDWSGPDRERMLERLESVLGDEGARLQLPLHRSGYHLFVAADILEERLAFAQMGELQLGKTLFKISPLFEKYHRGAFERELLVLLYQSATLDRWRPETWTDWRFLASAWKLVSRHRLESRVRDLRSLKELAGRLDFIPLFDDILEGRALQNNEAFLGRRESPSLVDSQPTEVLLETLAAEEILERVEYCSGPGQGQNLSNWLVGDWCALRKGLPDLRQHLSALPWNGELCPTGVKALFERRPVTESYSVDLFETTSARSKMRFTREVAEPYEQSLFVPDETDYIGNGVYRDSPVVRVGVRGSESIEALKVWEPISLTQESLEFEFDNAEKPVGRIEQPTLSDGADRQVYPREAKFRITGLKFAFDSSAEDAEVSSGVEFRLLGDDYSRRVELGLTLGTIEQRADLGFRLDLGPFFGITRTATYDDQWILPLGSLFRAIPLELGIEEHIPGDESETTSLIFGLGADNLEGDALVSQGLILAVRYRWQVLEGGRFSSELFQEYTFGYDQAMGPMTTLSFRPVFGLSSAPVNLSDYVPGSTFGSDGSVEATEFLALRSELRGVVASRFNWNILDNLLFQDIVLFGSHSAALDNRVFTSGESVSEMLQSVEVGLRLYGAVFGAKNQSLGLGVVRTISRDPRNSFALTIGRN